MLRSLIDLKPREVPLRVALRNTVAVIAPLAVGLAIDQVPAGLAMTVGGLNTMFTDLPGPYRLRMLRMLAAAFAAGLSALVGITIGVHTGAFIVATALFAFAGGMLVALGPVAARVGLTSMIVMMVTADMRVPVAHALGVAGAILAGGLLQMLFAVAAWPLQRYRPERFALATVLAQLADAARTRTEATLPPPVTQAANDAMQLLHGEHRARGMAAQSFRIIAEVCERVRIDLITLGDLHARIGDAALRDALERVLDASATTLRDLGGAMEQAEKPGRAEGALSAVEFDVDALAKWPANRLDPRDRRLLRIAVSRCQGLAGQLRTLVRNGDWASSRGEIRAEQAEARLPAALRPGNPWRTLRANLKPSSVALRHAIRCTACLTLSVACERALQLPHGVWIPMTAAIVLKPDFGGTLRFGVLRTVGTFAGLLLTSVITHFAMDGVVLRLSLMAAMCLAFRLLAQVNYAIAVAMLTGMLVLLLSFEGIAPGDAIELRIFGTCVGSVLALVAYSLWPTWEGRRVDAALGSLIAAYRAHIRALLAGDVAALLETRSAARAARTNAQASLERLRSEPRRARNRHELADAESLLANANRLIRAAIPLEAALRDAGTLPALPELRAFADDADAALGEIVTAMTAGAPLRRLSVRGSERKLAEHLAQGGGDDAGDTVQAALADACDRIADAIDTLAHALRAPDPVAVPADAARTAAG